MDDIAKQRLEKLKNDHWETYEAVKWLQDGGKERFKGEVYLPPYLSIRVPNKSLASLAETCFRQDDLLVLSFH
jgi:hypothetical protein